MKINGFICLILHLISFSLINGNLLKVVIVENESIQLVSLAHDILDIANESYSNSYGCSPSKSQNYPFCQPGDVLITGNKQCCPARNYSESCRYSEQCRITNSVLTCYHEICRCDHSTYDTVKKGNKTFCLLKNIRYPKSKDVYKAAMVALACFMVTVIGLFVLFICNRTFFRRRGDSVSNELRLRQDSQSDVFNVSNQLAAMDLCDKPPTYDDVLKAERMIRGIPPPAYNPAEDSTDSNLTVSNTLNRIPLRAVTTTSTLPPSYAHASSSRSSLSTPTNCRQSRSSNMYDITTPSSYTNSGFVSEA